MNILFFILIIIIISIIFIVCTTLRVNKYISEAKQLEEEAKNNIKKLDELKDEFRKKISELEKNN